MKRKNCYVGAPVYIKDGHRPGEIVQLFDDDGYVLVEDYTLGRGMYTHYHPSQLRKRVRRAPAWRTS